MNIILGTISIIFLISFNRFANSYKILAVLPHQGLSHFFAYQPVLEELAKRGHAVTVISPYPRKNPLQNYTDIDVSSESPPGEGKFLFEKFSSIPSSLYDNMKVLYHLQELQENVVKSPKVQKILKSNNTYDLLITESFNTRLYYSFAYKLKIPFISLSSHVLMPFAAYDIANPVNPAFIPLIMNNYDDRMTFFERFSNALGVVAYTSAFEWFFDREARRFATKYVDENVPPLREIAKNMSLIMTNAHFSISKVRPLTQAVIDIGGVHIKPASKLPMEIETFINESEHGVIYFCMGSLLRGSSFPEEKKNAFLEAFDRIPQRILWKWEGEQDKKLSNKVMMRKWMPQRDILAHPNVRLFISHGGLLGTNEAVYEGVPILGIPIFGDQMTNIKAMVSNGAGEMLNYNEITEEVVYQKLNKILQNPKYRENAKILSSRFRDRPMSPIDTAVYWTEYVIRHKGAPHLRSAAVDLAWYQYLLLDVVIFSILILIAFFVIIFFTLKYVYGILISSCYGKSKANRVKEKCN